MITVLSGLSFLLLLIGFGLTLQSHFFGTVAASVTKTEANSSEKAVEGRTLVALGDSLTRGTGDSNGKGYVGYLVDLLEEQSGEKVVLQNLGVKGYRSDQLLELVKQQEVKRQIQDADWIVMTIGGNDLFRGGRTLIDLDVDAIDKLREEYLVNFKQITNEIRSVNQDATIYYLGLYNPFINLDDSDITTKAVRQWNYETNEWLDQDKHSVFVPTFDLFQLQVDDFLFSDKFHPNTIGYQMMAERVAALITK
ncbi:GDSL family lipase [Ammoniphilus sp. CFH 90114]|nr:GDSL family lipase [Ammoniphilus sp. CFH 90114]